MTVRVLILAGVDPCGGAGLTADARVVQALGGAALTVPTCWTVQNRSGFESVGVVDRLADMLRAVREDGPIDGVKIGLLPDVATAHLVRSQLSDLRVPVVVDPVLSATAGGLRIEHVEALCELAGDLGAVVTPNTPELERLGGAESLLEAGCTAVLHTGGHDRGRQVVDRLITEASTVSIRHTRLVRGPVHGTGCALSTALSVRLASGEGVESAARRAVESVAGWIRETPASRRGRAEPLRILNGS